MKKFTLIALLLAMITTSVFGDDAGMKETQDYIVGGATIFGLIIVVIINLFWVIFPGGAGYMSYAHYKKQSQNSQEDNGIKAAGAVFASVLAGFLAAYFIVGSIGKYASDGQATDLSGGNKYMVSSFIGAVVSNFKTRIENQ